MSIIASRAKKYLADLKQGASDMWDEFKGAATSSDSEVADNFQREKTGMRRVVNEDGSISYYPIDPKKRGSDGQPAG